VSGGITEMSLSLNILKCFTSSDRDFHIQKNIVILSMNVLHTASYFTLKLNKQASCRSAGDTTVSLAAIIETV